MVRTKAAPVAASTSLEGVTIAFASFSPSCHPHFTSKTVTHLKADIANCGGSYASKVDQCTHLIATRSQFDKKLKAIKEGLTLPGLVIVDYAWLALSLTSASPVAVDDSLLEEPSAAVNGTSDVDGANGINGVHGDSEPEDKPAPAKQKQSLKRKRGDTDADADDTKSAKSKSASKAPPTKPKAPVLNIPVDDYVSPAGSYTVFVDDDGLAWDATLNQSNSNANNNKFYRIQVLVDSSDNHYCWTRWGRVGERGQGNLLQLPSLSLAMGEFEKKFRSKNGNPWANRDGPAKAGKYVFLEINYAESDDDEPPKSKATVKQEEEADEEEEDLVPVQSTLDKPIQSLMELIFNITLFNSTMVALNYDANKMPLGKLSKKTLLKGYEVLKELAALIADPNSAAATGTTYGQAVQSRSNLYFSLVPHVVGRNRLPTLDNMDLIKKEIELLETLTDMQLANEIMKSAKASKSKEKIHMLDRQFAGLGMQEMSALDSRSKEFKEIDTYLRKTHGATHGYSYQVEDIFRIERTGEDDRFQGSEFNGLGAKSDRRLLWHGSRVTNFGGILSQGLRIAPPEAPVSGYMFGKGVYLADMSSKSAGYCSSHNSNGTGLLLLCEAELGKPPLKLTDADYDAGKKAKDQGSISTWGVGQTAPLAWKDASCIHKSLKGVSMPDVDKVQPGATNESNAWLLYNEYIVYDVSQIKLRYLLRVKM